MMTIHQIYKLIDQHYPFKTQYRWDKSGLTANVKKNTEATKVLLCLDLDKRSLAEALKQKANLVLCHHPIMPGPSTQKLIKAAKAAKVSYIAAHSNFDKSANGMNKLLAEKLGLKNIRQHKDHITMLGSLPRPYEHKELALFAKKAFNTKQTTIYACRKEPVQKVGLVGGAGMSHIASVRNSGIDCFITGDVKWHGYREAHAYGIDVIDVEHYAEQIFIEAMEKLLAKNKVPTKKIYPLDERIVC